MNCAQPFHRDKQTDSRDNLILGYQSISVRKVRSSFTSGDSSCVGSFGDIDNKMGGFFGLCSHGTDQTANLPEWEPTTRSDRAWAGREKSLNKIKIVTTIFRLYDRHNFNLWRKNDWFSGYQRNLNLQGCKFELETQTFRTYSSS